MIRGLSRDPVVSSGHNPKGASDVMLRGMNAEASTSMLSRNLIWRYVAALVVAVAIVVAF